MAYLSETEEYTLEYHTDAGKVFYWNNKYDRSGVRPQFRMHTDPEHARKMEKWSRVKEILKELQEDGEGLLVAGTWHVMFEYHFFYMVDTLDEVPESERHLYSRQTNGGYFGAKERVYYVFKDDPTVGEVELE